MSTDVRNVWSRPLLVVLGRRAPEESVLAACKISGQSGPKTKNVQCTQNDKSACAACADLVGS